MFTGAYMVLIGVYRLFAVCFTGAFRCLPGLCRCFTGAYR